MPDRRFVLRYRNRKYLNLVLVHVVTATRLDAVLEGRRALRVVEGDGYDPRRYDLVSVEAAGCA